MNITKAIGIGGAAVAAAATLAAAGGAARPLPRICPPLSLGGHHWIVYKIGPVDCGTAQALVRGLAGVKAPGPYFNLADPSLHLTAYKSWHCPVLLPGRKAVFITCSNGKDKIINGRDMS